MQSNATIRIQISTHKTAQSLGQFGYMVECSFTNYVVVGWNSVAAVWNCGLLKFSRSWTFRLHVIKNFGGYWKLNCNNDNFKYTTISQIKSFNAFLLFHVFLSHRFLFYCLFSNSHAQKYFTSVIYISYRILGVFAM